MIRGLAIAFTITLSSSRFGRSHLVARQVAVLVAIERLERRRRICDFAGRQFTVTVRIKCQDDRIPRHATALPTALRSTLGATLNSSRVIRASPDAALTLSLALPLARLTRLLHPLLILLLPLWQGVTPIRIGRPPLPVCR